jgi:oxygen-independent coproporphyrinogen-3 oxidase
VSSLEPTLELLRKYDKPGPRYTSYPTAVEFHAGFGEADYRERLEQAAQAPQEPLSLYLHLPFCEERCSFCGCMVVITRKREVAAHYLGYLHRELALLAGALRGRRHVVQYHWGGGTPTYLSLAQMEELQSAVTRHFDLDPGAEVAVEIDPRVTSFEQLDLLRRMDFNRLSMGVQDFARPVQEAINRIQTVEETRALYDHARALGFGSINLDLIYGLPFQTSASFAGTLDTVIDMRPDRLAVYSYAHVPWVRGNQKKIQPQDLPEPAAKLRLFVEARERFLEAGYRPIGMDHFALPEDELSRAAEARQLHRNFMGYTTRPAPDMVGAGVSAIGDLGGAFAQNTKKLTTYYAALDASRFPIERGYALDADDRLRRHVIAQLMCNFSLDRGDVGRRFGVDFDRYFALELAELRDGPAAHGFLEIHPDRLEVTERGCLFVRNVCMVFDRYLRAKTSEKPVFSQTV